MPGLDVDQLAEVIDRLQTHPLAVSSKQCTRVRHRRSTCSRCVDVCPADAISWEDGLQVDWDKCTGCGLCAAVCPSGALDLQSPARAEILQQVERIAREQGSVTFVCPRAQETGAAGQGCLSVHCIGQLDESLLVGAVAYGAQPVWLVDGACESCPQAAGRAVAGAMAARSNQLLEAFGVAARIAFRSDFPRAAGSRSRSQADEQGVSRRDLFKTMARETARIGAVSANTMQPDQAAQAETENVKGKLPSAVPDRRVQLLAALKRLGQPVDRGGSRTARTEEDGLFARFSLGDKCTACQMCAFFCPTGALVKVEDQGRVGLAFRSALCTNCGLCRDICYRDAVLLDHTVDLNGVLALAVDWLFVGELEEPPWKKPPDRRVAEALLGMMNR
jgi:Pyruvate/2-oxoacid:ferredoxin oxidoreductase delta subunit